MVILYILLAIALLVAAILLLPVHLRVRYDETAVIDVGVLFFRYRLYPRAPRPLRGKAKQKKKAQKKPKKANKKSKDLKELHEAEKKGDKPELVRVLGRIVPDAIARVFGKVTVKIEKCVLIAGGKDAAQTALLFGALSQGVSYLFGILEQQTRLKIKKGAEVAVLPDYLEAHIVAEVDATVSLRLASVLWTAIRGLFSFIKIKNGVRRRRTERTPRTERTERDARPEQTTPQTETTT